MAGDGTTFEIDIPVNGAGVEPAAMALARLAQNMVATSKASEAAASAVKLGEAAYKQAESSADKAAKAVEKLGMQADAQRAKMAKLAEGKDGAVNIAAYQRAAEVMSKLTAAQGAAAARAAATAAAVATEATALDKLKAAADKASKAEMAASAAVDKGKIDAGTGKVNEMAEGFGKLGGPLGALGQKAFGAADGMKKLSASLGSAGPYAAIAIALVAIVAGIAAISVAAIGATVSVGAWAVGLADAARTQGLLAAGVAQSVKGGKELADSIDDISSRVPMTSEELMGLAGPLAQAGLKGKALSAALEDAAVKASTAKFGPDFAKQLNALPSLAARAEKSFSRIFGGLKIDKLLEGLGSMVGLFDKGSASANAISAIFESLFQPLIDATTGAIPDVIASFIQFEIMVMKAAIRMKLIWQEWGGVITGIAAAVAIVSAVIGGVLLLAIGAVVVSIGMLAFAVGLVVGAFTALVLGVLWVGAQFTALGGIIVGAVGPAFDWLKNAAQGAIDWLSSLSLTEIGTNMIMGLVNGLLAAGPAVLAAVSGIAGGAIKSAISVLKIGSPSKVFADIGAYTAEGMAQGIDEGHGDVQGAMTALVAPPDAATPSAASSSGGGNTFHIYVTGGGDAQSIAEAVRDAISDLLIQVGGGVRAA